MSPFHPREKLPPASATAHIAYDSVCTRQHTEYITMASQRRRAYHAPISNEIILFVYDYDHEGWVPDNAMLNKWRDGRICVYIHNDGSHVTTASRSVPGFLNWPLMTAQEAERSVREWSPHPWIAASACVTVSDDAAMHEHFAEATPLLTDDIELEPSYRRYRPPPIEIPSLFQALLEAAATASAESPTLELPGHRPGPEQPQCFALPRHVAALVIREACATGACCPITMEPITAEVAAVTSCGHVFSADAIACWLATHTTCPECRSHCVV